MYIYIYIVYNIYILYIWNIYLYFSNTLKVGVYIYIYIYIYIYNLQPFLNSTAHSNKRSGKRLENVLWTLLILSFVSLNLAQLSLVWCWFFFFFVWEGIGSTEFIFHDADWFHDIMNNNYGFLIKLIFLLYLA